MKFFWHLAAGVCLLGSSMHAQDPVQAVRVSKVEALADLAEFTQLLETYSSYAGLNGYDFRSDLAVWTQSLTGDSVEVQEMIALLVRVVGQIGDRHSSVRSGKNDRYLPFIVAPYKDRVLALQYHRSDRQFQYLYPAYPQLTAIDGVPIEAFLLQTNIEDQKAPQPAWSYEALRQIRFLEECFNTLGKPMEEVVKFTFSGVIGDTIVALPTGQKSLPAWTEKMAAFAHEDEGLNDSLVWPQYFRNEGNGVSRIYLPQMVKEKKAPLFYQRLRDFMETEVANSEALIIDIRSNGGGRRELIMALAEYLVHPDSIHVVNVAQQRGDRPLTGSYQRDLHRRYLFNLSSFDDRERAAILAFEETFHPVYYLDSTRFSERHYTVLNGAKLRPEIYLDLPVYVLMNERSFSAASILAAIFKDLPNVTLVGVNTDGSSGNSEVNYLTHTGIRIRVSTMVSFQKDGQLLDGSGTAPDLKIERDIQQLFWKEDTQLRWLLGHIESQTEGRIKQGN